jgi:regulator of chromosome condensation
MGFSRHVKVQKAPVPIPDLKDIRQLAAGNNHVLALDGKGKVFAWGCGEQNQLGRRVFDNHPELALRPTSIGTLPVRGAKAVQVACGSYHSFAVDGQGRVYAWGLNTYAQLGIADEAGESNASHLKPRLVESLRDHKVVSIAGGEHHSLASTDGGKLLTWGRMDGDQVGLRAEAFTPENTVFDERGNPRILKNPTIIPGEEVFDFMGMVSHSKNLRLKRNMHRYPSYRIGCSRHRSQLCPYY